MAESLLVPKDIWENSKSFIGINPKIPEQDVKQIKAHIDRQNRDATVWLQSSGTESGTNFKYKFIALPIAAILHAAESVNGFFSLSSQDVWLNTLPTFHVGGLSIYARAFLAGSRVYEGGAKWSPPLFVEQIEQQLATVTSLVPTQVFDLVEQDIRCPQSLRLVFVGGGALNEQLYLRAKQLGWPLCPSYGMTEACAMIAVAPDQYENARYQLLPHVSLSKKSDHQFIIETKSKLAGTLLVGENHSEFISQDGPYVCDDNVEIGENSIRVLGRASELVKILGESVNLVQLENRLKKHFDIFEGVALWPKPDERRGYQLILVGEMELSGQELESFNAQVLPFERVQAYMKIDKLPRTELGKINRHLLGQALQ